MHCLTCHYDLTHLAAHRCPECGRRFNPTDPNTFEDPADTERFRQFAGILMACSYLGTLMFLCVVRYPSVGPSPYRAVFSLWRAAVLALFMWPVTFLVLFIAYLLLRPLFGHPKRTESKTETRP